MSDRLVLAMDGSTRVASAALLRGGDQKGSLWEVASARAEVDDRGQARILLWMVDDMLEELGAEASDLGCIVVGVGPGTFTGVRIAVATARGLSLGLAVPVLGASTLSALAAGAVSEASAEERADWSQLVPVIDARRHQVFLGIYGASGVGGRCDGPRWSRRGPYEVRDQGSLASLVEFEGGGESVVIGESAALAGALPGGIRFIEQSVRAEYLVAGQDQIQDELAGATAAVGSGSTPDSPYPGLPETVKPIYVRAPDADVHITKMKDPWADGRV